MKCIIILNVCLLLWTISLFFLRPSVCQSLSDGSLFPVWDHFSSACLPACQPACLPACLSACLPACLYACLPVCLPVLWHKFRLIHFVPWIKYEQIVFHCHVLDRGLCSQSQCWGWQHWKLTIADGKNEKKWLWLGVVSWWNNLIPR